MLGQGYVQYYFTNLLSCDYNSASGDSGGIVYEVNTRKVVGIHHGRVIDAHGNSTSYASQAKLINRAWGLTLE